MSWNLLLEGGDGALLESGDKLVTEDYAIVPPAASATASATAPVPQAQVVSVVASATATGPAPVPVVAVAAVSAAATSSGPVPVAQVAFAGVSGSATASMAPPTVIVLTPPRTGGVLVPRFDYEVPALLPIRPPAAVAVASMAPPRIVITENVVEPPPATPEPLPKLRFRRVKPPPRPVPEPVPVVVHAEIVARSALVSAGAIPPSLEVLTFEQSAERMMAPRVIAAKRRAEEEHLAMLVLSSS